MLSKDASDAGPERVGKINRQQSNSIWITDSNDERAQQLAREWSLSFKLLLLYRQHLLVKNKEEKSPQHYRIFQYFWSKGYVRYHHWIIWWVNCPICIDRWLYHLCGTPSWLSLVAWLNWYQGPYPVGLVGALAAKSESEYYFSQVKRKIEFFVKPSNLNPRCAEIMFELGPVNKLSYHS